jgi:hypothetical protein
MRLDPDSLDVQSFPTNPTSEPAPAESDGIMTITVVTVPKPVDPETHFYPCTRQLTCSTCV